MIIGKPQALVLDFDQASPEEVAAQWDNVTSFNSASNTVDSIRSLLGHDVVLLPIPSGQKGPVFSGWNEVTVEKMSEPQYLAQFTGNVGVLLGKPSGNLCTIDVDSDDDFRALLESNPQFLETLLTIGSRGGNVWFRVKGDYPSLTKIKTGEGKDWGEFRSDGGQTIVHGVHPSGKEYARLLDTPPIEIVFESIIWPDNLVLPWAKDDYDVLVEKEGEPFQYGDKNKLSLNEPAIAAKFAMEHLTLFEMAEGNFYQYEDASGLWEIKTEDQMKNRFSDDLKLVSDELKDTRLLTHRTSTRLMSLTSHLKGKLGRKGVFEQNRSLIHCQNGVLDLSTRPPQFRTFHPDDYSRNASPVAYDSAATCPRFLNELLGAALNRDDISLIQRVGGAMLMGRNPAQQFLLLTGTAGGGKSTLVSIIEKIVGLQNVAELRTEHLGGRFELHAFLGKTLLTGKDVAPDFLQQKGTSRIKSLVGGDLVQCEQKGGDHFQIRGDFNMIITCNSRLRIRLEGDVDAWTRRLLAIQYERPKPAIPVADFADNLIIEEGAGILNFFVEGALQHLEELRENGSYRITDVQNQRVQAILLESDSIREFVQSEVGTFNQADVTSHELVQAYGRYCERQGWHAFAPHEVNARMRDLILEIHHVRQSHDIERDGKPQRGYRGLRAYEDGQV